MKKILECQEHYRVTCATYSTASLTTTINDKVASSLRTSCLLGRVLTKNMLDDASGTDQPIPPPNTLQSRIETFEHCFSVAPRITLTNGLTSIVLLHTIGREKSLCYMQKRYSRQETQTQNFRYSYRSMRTFRLALTATNSPRGGRTVHPEQSGSPHLQ